MIIMVCTISLLALFDENSFKALSDSFLYIDRYLTEIDCLFESSFRVIQSIKYINSL